jgi:hypothetical protein
LTTIPFQFWQENQALGIFEYFTSNFQFSKRKSTLLILVHRYCSTETSIKLSVEFCYRTPVARKQFAHSNFYAAMLAEFQLKPAQLGVKWTVWNFDIINKFKNQFVLYSSLYRCAHWFILRSGEQESLLWDRRWSAEDYSFATTF